MEEDMSKMAEIKLTIELGSDNVPTELYWEATESEYDEKVPCDAVLLSMWDKNQKNSLMIDLWTKQMEIGEMNTHVYFTFLKIADTYERATNNPELAGAIRKFANEFAESVKKHYDKET